LIGAGPRLKNGFRPEIVRAFEFAFLPRHKQGSGDDGGGGSEQQDRTGG
jgi:hypothetical protein